MLFWKHSRVFKWRVMLWKWERALLKKLKNSACHEFWDAFRKHWIHTFHWSDYCYFIFLCLCFEFYFSKKKCSIFFFKKKTKVHQTLFIEFILKRLFRNFFSIQMQLQFLHKLWSQTVKCCVHRPMKEWFITVIYFKLIQ